LVPLKKIWKNLFISILTGSGSCGCTSLSTIALHIKDTLS